ncbi:Glutamine cyclotransferase [compost metagenome]
MVGVIDLAGLLPADQVKDPNDDVLNGIAWDAANRRLFVTGKNWPSLFEIRLTGPR